MTRSGLSARSQDSVQESDRFAKARTENLRRTLTYVEGLMDVADKEAGDYWDESKGAKLFLVLGITSIRAAPSSQIAAVIEL